MKIPLKQLACLLMTLKDWCIEHQSRTAFRNWRQFTDRAARCTDWGPQVFLPSSFRVGPCRIYDYTDRRKGDPSLQLTWPDSHPPLVSAQGKAHTNGGKLNGSLQKCVSLQWYVYKLLLAPVSSTVAYALMYKALCHISSIDFLVLLLFCQVESAATCNRWSVCDIKACSLHTARLIFVESKTQASICCAMCGGVKKKKNLQRCFAPFLCYWRKLHSYLSASQIMLGGSTGSVKNCVVKTEEEQLWPSWLIYCRSIGHAHFYVK